MLLQQNGRGGSAGRALSGRGALVLASGQCSQHSTAGSVAVDREASEEKDYDAGAEAAEKMHSCQPPLAPPTCVPCALWVLARTIPSSLKQHHHHQPQSKLSGSLQQINRRLDHHVGVQRPHLTSSLPASPLPAAVCGITAPSHQPHLLQQQQQQQQQQQPALSAAAWLRRSQLAVRALAGAQPPAHRQPSSQDGGHGAGQDRPAPAGAAQRGGPLQPRGKGHPQARRGRAAGRNLQGPGGRHQLLCRCVCVWLVLRGPCVFSCVHHASRGSSPTPPTNQRHPPSKPTTNSVPFEEDDKDSSIWFLDHSYLENMFRMFKKVNGA
jgi:hypothetical protein